MIKSTHNREPHSGVAEILTRPRTVCVVGLGYIGLPTAAVLADRGYRVFGVDVRHDVVDTINRGEIHIHEPHLDELVSRVVSEGMLSASTTPQAADVFFICVPTPIREDKSPDLSYVCQAARTLRQYVQRGNTVILESTSPPGTTEKIVIPEAIPPHLQAGSDVSVAYCPERVLPGRILIEVIENDRVVGGVTPQCTRRVKQFYETFVRGEVLATTATTAEMTKLAENAYRDVNIAFANELSMLADQMGADVFDVIRLANRHPRVNVLTPGPGVGGHCISVDPWFLVDVDRTRTPLLQAARGVNCAKPQYVAQQVLHAAASFAKPVVGCLGLAYKADVDDLRESPSIEIVRQLSRHAGLDLLVCEPYVSADAFREFRLCPLDHVVSRANVLVLLTDHSEFRDMSAEQLSGKAIIDTRGVWRHLIPTDETTGYSAASVQQQAA